MSKRLGVKLAVMVAAVCAMTLLQGCDGEEDGTVISTAWTPVGYPWTLYYYAGYGQSLGGDAGQAASTAGSGGSTVAGAISSARGTGGGQVSAGGGF